jgi:hypothetical protein
VNKLMTLSFKVLVCALIATAPTALVIEGINATTAQAQASALTSLTAEPSVDSSTAAAVLVD